MGKNRARYSRDLESEDKVEKLPKSFNQYRTEGREREREFSTCTCCLEDVCSAHLREVRMHNKV